MIEYPLASLYKEAIQMEIIQGSFGVFDTRFKAEDIYQRWGHKRHYINPDEEIKLSDETIATCTQWNPENIKQFLNQANSLGLKIEIK